MTTTSAILSWVPGFDGGFAQSFTVRYRKRGVPHAFYVDVSAPESESNATSSQFEVGDLTAASFYAFAIRASNEIGHSEYTKDIGEIETRREYY